MIAVMPPPSSSSAAGARVRFTLFAVAAGLFFGLPALLSLAADWHWFSEVGYLPILKLSITAHSLIGAAVFAVAAGWLSLNLRGAWQALAEEPLSFTTREGFTVALPSRAQLRPLALLGAMGGAFLIASYASNQWLMILTWWKHVPFGTPDPILGLRSRVLHLHGAGARARAQPDVRDDRAGRRSAAASSMPWPVSSR